MFRSSLLSISRLAPLVSGSIRFRALSRVVILLESGLPDQAQLAHSSRAKLPGRPVPDRCSCLCDILCSVPANCQAPAARGDGQRVRLVSSCSLLAGSAGGTPQSPGEGCAQIRSHFRRTGNSALPMSRLRACPEYGFSGTMATAEPASRAMARQGRHATVILEFGERQRGSQGNDKTQEGISTHRSVPCRGYQGELHQGHSACARAVPHTGAATLAVGMGERSQTWSNSRQC